MSGQLSTQAEPPVRAKGPHENFVRLLCERARAAPERVAFTFLADGEDDRRDLTYGELDRRARAAGAWLQERGAAGGRVLLLYPPGLDYIAAFWGCLYAGAVAVPAYPPRPNRSLERLQAVAADARACAALTTSAVLSRVTPLLAEAPALRPLDWLDTDSESGVSAEAWREPDTDAETPAFLQYTSGSTAMPKGVVVTHGNLLHNEELIRLAFGQTEESVIVGWLPLYHDMGLIGNVLQPLYAGARCVLMSPLAFLQRPARWLEAVTRFRATTSGGPNFAYELCARKVTARERAALDLSTWSVAFNGAEPVRAETLERFAQTFGDCGFRREAFHPCYGLAEATLLVSAGGAGRVPRLARVRARDLDAHRAVEAEADEADARTLVSCGRELPGQRVVVVNPETEQPCAPGVVGEIWVAGPSVAAGYWGRPEETERTFGACLRDTGEGPFLRTGDLGFEFDGELFVTGRLKDLIIIRGRNLYPQDIERTAEACHAALRPGGGAAFSVEAGGEERLVVVQEVERSAADAVLDEAVARIREALADEHEVQPQAVLLVKAGQVPKTSSGKVRRGACRESLKAGDLKVLREWREGSAHGVATPSPSPRSETEAREWLRGLLAAKLGHAAEEIDASLPITRYGVDSLAAVELSYAVETELGATLAISSFLDGRSLEALAAEAWRLSGEGGRGETCATPQTSPHEPDAPRASDAAPLSHGQQALWFLHRMAPESAAYNIGLAFRVRGALDLGALRRAFQSLVKRHEALRTTFTVLDGEPAQLIKQAAEVCFEVEDGDGLDEAAVREWAAEHTRRRFDLEAGPLLRVGVLRCGAAEHALSLVVHHIVADLWSLAVLMRELGVLYEAGGGAPLPPPRARYAEHARRQARMLEGAEGRQLRSFWEGQLAGELPTLNLPTDRPRPPVQTFRGASESFRVNAELTARLKQLGRAHDATLYATLLCAFQLLLARHTGQEEVLVGSPSAGRARAELSDVVGYFTNPLVVRTRVAGSESFAVLLGRVRRALLDAFAHQDYPFPLLVQGLQPERDASRSPLFQAMFVWQQAPHFGGQGAGAFALGESGGRARLGRLELESLGLEQRFAQFDLSLAMAEGDGELLGSLEYNTDLFEAETARSLCLRFVELLGSAVAEPARPAAQLRLLPEEERRLLLEGFGGAPRPAPTGACIHELFERQAALTPDAEALVAGRERLTYQELNERADRLARHLRSLGVGPESPVGVCVGRSSALVVGLLGILKAGGAYIPLDPAYPRERLAFMLEDSDACVLLTERRLLADLPPHRAHAVVLDEPETFAGGSSADPRAVVTDEGLAYVIYTSGSTGRPKGVAIEHRSAVVLLRWAARQFNAAELSGVLASTSICFDLSVFELFAPLAAGGTVVLAQDALALPGLEAAGEVTLVNTVPSAMAELVRADALPRSVLTVNLAGEPLKGSLARQVYESGVARVINLYGPSEDTTYSTAAVVPHASTREPTIGRPLDGTRVYVLDGHQQLVPQGVAGELYLGGAGLARGYLNRPGLTAERFIPDSLCAELGERLYRTGDLVRWVAGGELEFLGRIDQQVKVRGFRIELGEVEAALLELPEVRDCVVAAREDETGGKYLAAYLVAETGGRPEATTPAWLRAHLRGRLPEHMVPTSFVLLDALPLTPNGKVDRKALPEPGGREAHGAGEYVAPRTETERRLADIWRELLRVERVGADDNFFLLGGHSLLAARAVARAREAFGVELPLRAVFERPTLAGLAERLDSDGGAVVARAAEQLERVPRRDDLPLSFAQQRLWFLDQLEPGNSTYNMPAALRLEGALDAAALARGLSEIVRRHESLRTTFVASDGQPAQAVSPAGAFLLPLVDLSELTPAARESEARRLAAEESRRPFDLARDWPVRAALVRLGPTTNVLLVVVHHIASDGWSMGVFVGELKALYAAFAAGLPSPLAELPIQYADFAAWQRRLLTGERLEGHLAYWRRQLGGELPVLELPTDRVRPPVQTFNGATEKFEVPAALAAGLRALGRERGATLFMTLLASFQTMLSRYTGQTDIAVGTPVAGRMRPATEGLVGFFANTLVLRTDLSGDPTFRELLGRVRETTLEAHAHEELPFELLVEELRPKRELSHTPLFQVMLVLQNTPLPELSLPGVGVELLEVENPTAKFDLVLFVDDAGESLRCALEYNTDLFEAETARRMCGHFVELLGSAAAEPARRVSELRLLTEDEQRRALVEWNDTRRDYARGELLHELFEAQAALTPDAEAVIWGARRTTYSELEHFSNRIARRLRQLGVGPERRVGLCLPRTTSLVAAVLGVLKAGGAYVPLDPSYPRERLAFMLADAGPLVVVTERALLGALPDNAAQTLCLDADWEAEAADGAPPAPAACDANLAYVIYTSGSTGRPKGVAIKHRSAVVLVRWSQEVFNAKELRRVLASTSLSFDLSVFELFAPLSCGGAVVLADDALCLPGLEAAAEVTLINTVPSAMAELVRAGAVPAESGTINLAGEPLPPALAARLYELEQVSRVVNLYGPSEDTTYSTWSLVPPGSLVRIGRPVADTRVYVLDGHQQLVPQGVAGELYLGGAGLARGYLNRPGLTAERFIPDSLCAELGERLYRTGDLVRWVAGGELEFLGRIDQQVKVRGFRIELGEVEAALSEHESVRECVVVARAEQTDDRRLVAYVVGREMLLPTPGELRAHLRGHLPEYMVPAAFVLLDALPLTPNGKVDRKALPPPSPQSPVEPEAALSEARTPVEEKLSKLWAELLGREVGVGDNFFELGGHSLLATQVVSRVRELFGVELPLRTVFETPTVSELAERIEPARRAAEVFADGGAAVPHPPAGEAPLRGQDAEQLMQHAAHLREAVQVWTVPPIVPVPREAHLPLSYAQQRLWFLDRLGAAGAAYNILGGMRLHGPLDVSAFSRALDEILRRHEALRTTFHIVDGHPAQVVAPAQPLCVPYLDLRQLPAGEREARVRDVADEELKRGFDLAKSPLLRVRLARLADEEHVALVVMHHIASDGWSLGVFLKEFVALYEAARAGRPLPLPELAVQYADYAHWQRKWLRGAALEEHADYWRRVLGGTLPVTELRHDRPRPAVPTFRSARLRLRLPAELDAGLRELSRREGVTLFITTLAAFQTLLYRHTSQDDVIVGTAIAGRNRAETEPLIGVFINMLVLRTDLSGNPTFRGLLGRVRDVALGAYAHQDMPFEKLVDELQPERAQSLTPFFRIAFGLQHAPKRALRLPGLSLQQLTFDDEWARYDLTLWMLEDEDELSASWTYSTDLFEAQTVERLHGHFETLLASAVADPDTPLLSLQLQSAAERERREREEREWEEANFKKLVSARRRGAGRTPRVPAEGA